MLAECSRHKLMLPNSELNIPQHFLAMQVVHDDARCYSLLPCALHDCTNMHQILSKQANRDDTATPSYIVFCMRASQSAGLSARIEQMPSGFGLSIDLDRPLLTRSSLSDWVRRKWPWTQSFFFCFFVFSLSAIAIIAKKATPQHSKHRPSFLHTKSWPFVFFFIFIVCLLRNSASVDFSIEISEVKTAICFNIFHERLLKDRRNQLNQHAHGWCGA